MTTERNCEQCGVPFTPKKFAYRQMCCTRKCHVKKWQDRNRDKVRASVKKWTDKNRERVRTYFKQWYQDNWDEVNARAKQWQATNPDKVKTAQGKYKERNPDKLRDRLKRYRENNREQLRVRAKQRYYKSRDKQSIRAKEYWKNNRDKQRFYRAKRIAQKRKATPSWLSENDWRDIAAIYSEARQLETLFGTRFHVDHIVPLQGRSVCGLHVPWNLRPMLSRDNVVKNNRVEDHP